MSAKITAALHAVMSEVGYVQKTGKNAFHGYKYAGEADLLEKLRPAMLNHGLLLIPSVTDISPIDEHGNTTVRLEYTLVHKDGDVWPHPIGAVGTGNDRNKNGVGDKGTYKAITGANKYLLFKLFQIETGDDPEEAEEPPAKPVRVVTGKTIADLPPEEHIESEVRIVALLKTGIDAAVTLQELKLWWAGGQPQSLLKTLPDALRADVEEHKEQRKAELTTELRMAG